MLEIDRLHNSVSNPEWIAWKTVDALDELFNRHEWDFNTLCFEGLYDDETEVFELKSVCADEDDFLDKDTINEAYGNLDRTSKEILKLGPAYDNK